MNAHNISLWNPNLNRYLYLPIHIALSHNESQYGTTLGQGNYNSSAEVLQTN